MERVRNRGLEIVLGLALVAAIVLGVTIVWLAFRGHFSDKITVAAHLAQAGDALEQGDIVTYRNVIVGQVTGSTGSADGSAVAQLKIDPDDAKQIPAAVTAVAVPASLFGNTKIELLPAQNPSGPFLHDGSVVAADQSPAAESLQTALANAYQLLTSIHPAQLDAALSALATALDGQGANINMLIHKADDYLRKLAPHLPQLDDVITSLATVTDEIATNAPDLLDSLRNTLVVSKAILADKQVVSDLLAIAPTAVDNAQKLLTPAFVDNTVTILRDEVGVTAAMARHPEALADTLLGFKAFADTFNRTLTGKHIKVNILLTGLNTAALGRVALGQKAPVLDIVDPPEYTTADCPRYGATAGPNCGAAGTSSTHTRLLTTADVGYGGTASSVGSVAERHAVRAAASSITGLPESRLSGTVVDLLLGPMLRGTPTVVAGVRR